MAIAGISEEILRQLLLTSGHAYVTWIPGDRNPSISDSLASFLGYRPDFFQTAGIGELIRHVHKQERQKLLSILRAATQRGGSYECDFRIRGATGNYRWFRIRGASCEHDAQGIPTRLTGCITDIDELRQARLQAESEKEKSEWLRKISAQLFESMDPCRINKALDSLAAKLSCNRTYLRLKDPVGGDVDIIAESHAASLRPIVAIVTEKFPGLLQKKFLNLAPEQDIVLSSLRPQSSTIEHALSRALDVQHTAIIPLTKNGEIQGELVLMSAVSAHWSESDLQLAREFSQLVSLIFEREAIAAGLRQSNERFHLAMEASQDGLWDAQIGLDRVYVSPSYFRMAGYDLPGGIYPREITGTNIHPDDLLLVREGLTRFIRSKKDNDSLEFRLRHKNGSDVWVLSRMYKAEFNADGSPSRVFGVNTDITEFKRIQNYLKAAQSEADSANRAKSEFLARMSHEIRTPMNAILGLSHLILDSELDAEQRGYIRHIDDAAQLLLNVINDILDFSKIEAGKLALDETDFNLGRIISRLSNLLTYNAEEKNIWLVIDLEPDVPLSLHGDATRLQQILVNLLNNAIKFTSHGGVYFRIALNADRHFVFTVKDSGIGIDQESQRFLFMPFSQGDGSITRRYGGTGLGLAICKYLVGMMHGTIHFESTEGAGSQFTVTLPFDVTQPDDHAAQLSADKRIAIISGNPLVSRAAKNMFGRWIAEKNITICRSFRDFTDVLATDSDWLCLVDNDAMTASELTGQLTELLNQHPEKIIDYVYLGENNLYRKGKPYQPGQLSSDPFIRVSRPLTPEKIQALLFPERTDIAHDNASTAGNPWLHQKILLVEDNPVNQKVALGMLRKYDLDVEVVTDGQQAVDRLQQRGPHFYQLVLMDMEMPVMDGYAATREIRRHSHYDDLPIVAMTAHALKGDRDRCLAAGMNDYLSKPINPTLLHETLARYLQRDGRSIPAQKIKI